MSNYYFMNYGIIGMKLPKLKQKKVEHGGL